MTTSVSIIPLLMRPPLPSSIPFDATDHRLQAAFPVCYKHPAATGGPGSDAAQILFY